MTSTLDDMARRYLDLWQEQWASFVSNPDTAAQFAKMAELAGPAGGMMSRLFDPGGGFPGVFAGTTPFAANTANTANAAPTAPTPSPASAPRTPSADARSSSPPSSPTGGAEAPAAALHALIGSVVELARRVDTLGQRLDELGASRRPAPRRRQATQPAKPPKSAKPAAPAARISSRPPRTKPAAGGPQGKRPGTGPRSGGKARPVSRGR